MEVISWKLITILTIAGARRKRRRRTCWRNSGALRASLCAIGSSGQVDSRWGLILNNPSRTKEKIGDLVQEYAQRAIDAISSEDVLKIIPVVKTVAGGAAAIQSVRDEILNRKLEAFLEP